MSEEVIKIKADISDIQQKLAEIDKSMGKVSKTAEDTGNVFTDAFDEIAKNSPFGGIIDQIKKYTSGLATVKTSQNAVAVSSRGLAAAMLAIPILAIVAGFIALFNIFKSTEAGSKRLQNALAPLKGAFEGIWGVLQRISVIIVDQLINNFKLFATLASDVGRILIAVAKRDWPAVTSASVQFVTNAKSGIATVVNGYKDFTKELSNAGKAIKNGMYAQAEATKLEQKLKDVRIANIVPLKEAERAYQELQNAAKDQEKTETERIKLLDEAQLALKKITI